MCAIAQRSEWPVYPSSPSWELFNMGCWVESNRAGHSKYSCIILISRMSTYMECKFFSLKLWRFQRLCFKILQAWLGWMVQRAHCMAVAETLGHPMEDRLLIRSGWHGLHTIRLGDPLSSTIAFWELGSVWTFYASRVSTWKSLFNIILSNTIGKLERLNKRHQSPWKKWGLFFFFF